MQGISWAPAPMASGDSFQDPERDKQRMIEVLTGCKSVAG